MRHTPAGDAWRAVLHAHTAQTARVREFDALPLPRGALTDPASGPRADDLAVVDALCARLPPDSSVLDWSTSRLAPVVATRARLVSAPPADLVYSAHAIYTLEEIEAYLDALTRAARTWAAVLLFAGPPVPWLSEFWRAIHGEARLPSPHLPHVLDVLRSLGFESIDVEQVAVEPLALGSLAQAHAALRRRLYLRPDSAADQRLRAALPGLLQERDGVWLPRLEQPLNVAIVRWRARAAR